MFVFYDPNDSIVPGRILGSCYAASPTDQPGSMGGLPSLYLDDTQYANVAANLGAYKIVAGEPVAMSQAELDAIQASYVPPAPTTDEKVASLDKDQNLVKQSNQSNSDTLNSLIDTLSAKGLI